MNEPIEKFIKQEEDTVLAQAPVNSELYERVNKLRKKRGWTWPVLIEAMFKRLLEESKES